MYVTPMQNQVAAAKAQSSETNSAGSSYGSGIDGMFMQLLITQLQNQDPLNPMDPSTIVNQLVGVNTLDQVAQINQLLQSSLASASSDKPASAPTSSAGGH